ncbi:MAG: class I SAM-dependent DNA methyltransferase [Planctomycetes bacterium]|nr:class I SAM-dependent DNA methyltransferase [Planctomycetota bacterium]
MPLSWNEIRQRAIAFSRDWQDATDERAEAQTFWNEFFQVFGRSRRHIVAYEAPVKNLKGSYSFIDLIWPGTMIAEHKSRGKSLKKAESQAFDYVRSLIDQGRGDEVPRYIVGSDFERIAINDTESERVVEFAVRDLHKHIHEFAFIPGYKTVVTDPEDPVNIDAAEKLAKLKDALEDGGYPAHDLERFMVRVLFCLYAEDTGLVGERDAFRLYIENASKSDGSDLGLHLSQWFEVLDQPVDKRGKHLDEQLVGLRYVNGELFAGHLPFASFNREMRDRLLGCCRFDWSQISPAVFGSLFQSIMTARERRQIGAHYTTERDILKVIRGLFLDELWERFEKVRTTKADLQRFHKELGRIKILDPACGCGNFLVIAYRELRRLEVEVIEALYPKCREESGLFNVPAEMLINVDQMYGIEIEEWPAQIAKVALWLVDHQMNMELSLTFGEAIARLPLTHSAKIVNGNALRIDWNDVLPAEECSFVLGNPPFVGKKRRTAGQTEDMNIVFGEWLRVGALDYVCCWYKAAADYIANARARVAFVSTNSITQGEQPGKLWPRLFQDYGVHIQFAHRTFPWTSEARGKAHVHVVIIGFGNDQRNGNSIHDYDPNGEPLGVAKAANISPYLAAGSDAVVKDRSTSISAVPAMAFGNMPNDDGNLLISSDEREQLVASCPEAAAFVKELISSAQYLNGEKRLCLWLTDASPGDIRRLKPIQERVAAVKQFREASRRACTRELARYPTLFGEIRQPTQRYVLVPRHSSERRQYIPLSFFNPDIIVSDSCMSVAGASLYHFGVLHSEMHMAWVRQVCGRIKSDFRYSARLVYNNFPWPADPLEKQVAAVETSAREMLDARSQFPDASLADLYDPLSMPRVLQQAHSALDRAVDRCYRPQRFPDERRRFEYLFQLWERLERPLTSP